MTRRSLVAALLGFASFAIGQDEPLPKAETILDRFVEVTGGKAAYEKRKNIVETLTLEMAAQGLKGTITRYTADPAEEYAITEIDGVGKIEEGLHKGVAWDRNPMLGPSIKTGAERAQAVRAATFNDSLHWRDQYTKAETIGTEVLDGEVCYKVVLTPKEGSPETVYYQKKSGLAVKASTTQASKMGDVPTEAISGDYKVFGGVSIPTKVTIKFGGQEMTMTVMDVKINQPLPADRFEPPAEIKALIAKAAEKK
jgi:hypothetical protein